MELMTWIDVNEMLPTDEDNGREFICMTSAGGRCEGVIALKWEVATVRGKIVRRWMWFGRICPWAVTHWMNMPKPPQK